MKAIILLGELENEDLIIAAKRGGSSISVCHFVNLVLNHSICFVHGKMLMAKDFINSLSDKDKFIVNKLFELWKFDTRI